MVEDLLKKGTENRPHSKEEGLFWKQLCSCLVNGEGDSSKRDQMVGYVKKLMSRAQGKEESEKKASEKAKQSEELAKRLQQAEKELQRQKAELGKAQSERQAEREIQKKTVRKACELYRDLSFGVHRAVLEMEWDPSGMEKQALKLGDLAANHLLSPENIETQKAAEVVNVISKNIQTIRKQGAQKQASLVSQLK